jgi:response regulator of citrate/malate metabolism
MKLQATTTEFIRFFHDKMSQNKTYKAAYEAAEKVHVALTGSRRYADYESFRSVINKRAKKRKLHV